MARILVYLLILIFLPPKIALAELGPSNSDKACDYIASESSQEVSTSSQSTPDDNSQPELETETVNTEISEIETSSPETEKVSASKQEAETPAQPSISQDKQSFESKVALAGISIPSLWWAREQFDPFGGKLISNWLTNTKVKQIDLVVNWQFWTLLDYLGRYRFINQFGTVAREHGYDLRIFNQQRQCLALYEYNQVTNPPKWEIKIEGFGQESLQVLPDIN